MSLRFDYKTTDPASAKALRGLTEYSHGSGIEARLIHLIDVRASQINGCAFCIDMHTREAKADGETEQRLYALNAWRETPFFEERERAVLALTEYVTRIAEKGVPDDIYQALLPFFSPQQILQIIVAIIAINSWNRIAISTGMQPKAA